MIIPILQDKYPLRRAHLLRFGNLPDIVEACEDKYTEIFNLKISQGFSQPEAISYANIEATSLKRKMVYDKCVEEGILAAIE